MMKLLFLLWVFFLSFVSVAQFSAMIKAPQTSKEEFQTYIQTENQISYAMHQLQEIRKQNKTAKLDLQLLLEQAQTGFLKDHLKNAGELFKTITDQAYLYDWDQESQNIIFYAFLRLAQIEWKGESPEVFLYSAMLFAPHKQPHEELFPPPLVKKFNDLKQQLPLLTIHWDRIFSFHDTILVNGKEMPMNQSTHLPYGEYRVTALSSAHKKWSRKKVTLSQLVQRKIVTPALVQGSCEKPIIQNVLKKHKILFPNFCVSPLPVMNAELTRTLPVTAHKNMNLSKNSTSFSKSRLWKYSKWTLIGTGILASAFFIFSRDEGTTSQIPPISQKPTVTIGF